RTAIASLVELARSSKLTVGRVHALRTLEGLESLDDRLLVEALRDPHMGVREQALQMADSRLATSAALRAAVAALAYDNNTSVRVLFQLAFTLGELGDADAPELVAALAKVARRGSDDPWIGMAVLSSARRSAAALLESLASDKEFITAASAERVDFLSRLAR